MGGGISMIEGVEELMTTTLLIGRAISSMTFPGMFRIYDFHSKKAPRLQNARQFTFFAPDSDDEYENDAPAPDPEVYTKFFKVIVNSDEIYIENPLEVNDSGWTALHTCCMSMSTATAGLALIDEIVRLGGDLEVKTLYGPGTFNKGWTPLQMACGYGIDVLVEKLVANGANVNATNSFGFSCLHEACHRGFSEVVRHLLSAPHQQVDLSYIPPDEQAGASPFVSAPAQAALAEAARCGFYKIVQQLLDAGAEKDLVNRLGWTALHEACFYHRVETVKILLAADCDATKRTLRGALPYHLAGLPEIKQLLQQLGGEEAVPKEDDPIIDMLQVLTDLTLSEIRRGADDSNNDTNSNSNGNAQMIISGSREMPIIIFSPTSAHNGIAEHNNHNHSHNQQFHRQMKALADDDADGEGEEEKEAEVAAQAKRVQADGEDGVLHRGAVLGTLPALHTSMSIKTPPKKKSSRDIVVDDAAQEKAAAPSSSTKARKQKEKAAVDAVPADTPPAFLCALTRKIMSEPMKTIYGHVVDKVAIYQWFAQQGRICPLTGLPLAEVDLTPQSELGQQIRAWLLKRSLAQQEQEQLSAGTAASTSANTARPLAQGSPSAASGGHADRKKAANDDLYDF